MVPGFTLTPDEISMFQRIHPARRHVRPLVAALACGFFVSCSDDGILPPDPAAPAALEVVSRDPQPGVAGERLPEPVAVRVVDGEGRGIPGVIVQFSVTGGGGAVSSEAADTDGEGVARFTWVLGGQGEQTAAARVDGLAPVQLRARLVPAPASAAPMLGMLGDYIDAAIANLVEGIPLNPRLVDYFEDKLALLRTPGLAGDIIEHGRYETGSVASRSGRSIPVAAVFPLEMMRADAVRSIRFAETAVPVVEEFLGTPFPAERIRIWDGFIVGNSGGGGTLNMEDRATYEARTPATRLPYDAIIVHELSHSYVGSESLTQFLELYGYNVALTGSADVAAWPHTRGYVPGREDNEGVHALLDVYQLIGPAAMASAYRAMLPLRPPYGQPLSLAVQQAFVDAAPAAAKATVAAKMAKIVF